MPTYSTRFFIMDPANPPGTGTTLNYSVMNITDNNGDGDFDRNDNDNVAGVDISSSYSGDTVTVNVPGVGNVTYTGTTFYLSNGQRVFTPEDGQPLKSGTFVSSTFVSSEGPLYAPELGPACFTEGTTIETPYGPVLIEDLREGDLVNTLDGAPKPIRWIGRTVLRHTGKHAPVRFAKGAIGNAQELVVSPEHRMLLTGWQAELLTGESEVLIAAKHLVNGTSVTRIEGGSVTYMHLLFDAHEIIEAHGVYSESYFPGHAARLVNDNAGAELAELFPEMNLPDGENWVLARPELCGFEAGLMAA
jgi:Hint domain